MANDFVSIFFIAGQHPFSVWFPFCVDPFVWWWRLFLRPLELEFTGNIDKCFDGHRVCQWITMCVHMCLSIRIDANVLYFSVEKESSILNQNFHIGVKEMHKEVTKWSSCKQCKCLLLMVVYSIALDSIWDFCFGFFPNLWFDDCDQKQLESSLTIFWFTHTNKRRL